MSIHFFIILFLLAGAWPAQAGKNAFFVHAMNTESRAKAESVKKSLKRFGNVHIDQQGDHFIVRIGPINNGKKAVSVRNIVKDTHPDAFIKISASRPVTAKAAVPPRVSEPKSTVPVVVAQDAPHATPGAPSENKQPQPPEISSNPPEPAVTTSSPDMLLKEALGHYQAHRYENALQQLSLFLSLYPRDNNAPTAMFAVAGIQLEMKRPLPALRIYSHILERYAGTPEAIESIIALADMSMLSPGLKPSIAITGAQWYLDPVSAYNMVLSKNPPADLTERVLLQRISALRLKGRYQEAYDAGIQFLERYPQTKHQYPLMAALRSDVGRLIDEHIAAGDDIAVISILSNARLKGLLKKNNTDVVIKAAGSYSRLGMSEEARTLLSISRPFAAGQTPQIDAALEELARVATTPAVAPPATDRWSLYQTGRQQIRSSNLPDAEKTLAQMRGTDQDAFWSKLADFTLKDGAWTLKYKDYLKK
jgi:TolA-binding protein